MFDRSALCLLSLPPVIASHAQGEEVDPWRRQTDFAAGIVYPDISSFPFPQFL